MKELKRSFKQGDVVYVIDYWSTLEGTRAYAVRAEVIEVNEERKKFTAVICDDTYQTYSYNDYGRLVFDTEKEAKKAEKRFPKPNSTVFQVIGSKVYKKHVVGISGRYVNGVYDLVVCLNRGKNVSSKEIGHTLFYSSLVKSSQK